MSLKAFVAGLALSGYAAAQCSSSATMTIQNQGDASGISGCSTYTGSIAIATGTTSDISIAGVKAIRGDLSADNAVGLPSLSAPQLTSISGTFSLTNMTLLTSLSMGSLKSVGAIKWTTLPRLSSLAFDAGVDQANSVQIFDTELGSLDGIKLDAVSEFIISSNGQLNDIDLALTSVASTFRVEFNGRNTTVALPNLKTAYNMTFSNVSSVSIPSLASVNSSMGFFSCMFPTLSAPNLTTIGGDLSFVDDNSLTNVTMPKLQTVTGALRIANNTQFANINGFPALATVGGAIDFHGNVSNVELPALKNVAGAFNVQSTQDLTQTCNRFKGLQGRDNVIKGSYTCQGSRTTPGGVGSSSGSSTSTQSGAAGRDMFARSSAVTGVVGVVAALLGML